MKSVAENHTIVFADVAGSTRLYETIGDVAAKALIVDLQSDLADAVARQGGIVQEIVGDEVLVRFGDVNTAVSCTFALQEVTDSFSSRRGMAMAVRIGMHCGPVIVEEDRIFGDAVNTAARMAAIARGGQIIASEDVVKQLESPFNTVARRFDRVKVKGKSEPIVIYDLLWQPAQVTEIHSAALADGTVAAEGLKLCYRGDCRRLQPAHGTFAIGRSNDNDLVVPSGSVSRRHATVEFGRDRFVLLDMSTNGTYVQTQDGEAVYLRRESFPLWGQGRIALGAPVQDGQTHIVDFECGAPPED
jgi:class 3 adenylate cyclase